MTDLLEPLETVALPELGVGDGEILEPGARVAADLQCGHAVFWLVYVDGNRAWSACYIDGSLLRRTGSGGWTLHTFDGERTPAPTAALAAAIRCAPADPPVWPGQIKLLPPDFGPWAPVDVTARRAEALERHQAAVADGTVPAVPTPPVFGYHQLHRLAEALEAEGVPCRQAARILAGHARRAGMDAGVLADLLAEIE